MPQIFSENNSFVASKPYFSHEIDEYCPSYEFLKQQTNAKTVKDILVDPHLFWSLFCKVHMRNQDEMYCGEELLTPEMQTKFKCLNAKAVIMEVEENEDKTEYKIHSNKSRLKHLKCVVENLREVLLKSSGREISLNFNHTGQAEYFMSLNENDYYHELIKRHPIGTPEYLIKEQHFVGVSKDRSSVFPFCEEYEYKSCIKAAIPKLVNYLNGQYEFRKVHIHDIRSIYCHSDCDNSRMQKVTCELNEIKQRMIKKYNKRAFGLSTVNIETHRVKLKPFNLPKNFDLSQQTAKNAKNISDVEISAHKEAESLNHNIAKVPGKIVDYFESLISYLEKQEFFNALKLINGITLCMDQINILANSISSFFAWSRIFSLNERLQKIKKERIQLKSMIRNLEKDSLIFSIIHARIDCLKAQKGYARLSRIGKVLKFFDKVINNILTINRCLIALGLSLGAISSVQTSVLAYAGFWVVLAICTLKLAVMIYKNRTIIPYLCRKILNIVNTFTLNLLQSYEEKKLIKYKNDSLLLTVKQESLLTNLPENYSLESLEVPIKQDLTRIQKALKELNKKISATKKNIKIIRKKKLQNKRDLAFYNNEIEINIVKSKFKTLEKEDLFNLYDETAQASNNYYKVKKIRNFLSSQNVPIPKRLRVNDVINYITAEV